MHCNTCLLTTHTHRWYDVLMFNVLRFNGSTWVVCAKRTTWINAQRVVRLYDAKGVPTIIRVV